MTKGGLEEVIGAAQEADQEVQAEDNDEDAWAGEARVQSFSLKRLIIKKLKDHQELVIFTC